MGVDVAEYHGEAKHATGSYRFEEWTSPVSTNLKSVPFFIQAFGLLLAIIGAICVASQAGELAPLNAVNNTAIAGLPGQTAEFLSGLNGQNQSVVNITARLNWVLAAGVIAVIFIIIGWLEPFFSSEGSYGAGIGLFFPVSGLYILYAHQIYEQVSDFRDVSDTILTNTAEDTVIAGLLLLFIGGALAFISFITVYRQDRPIVLGVGAFIWLFEIIGAIVFLVWTQGQQPDDGVNAVVAGIYRQNQYLPYGIVAILQAFWILGASTYDHRCFFHANAAFAGYFAWYLMHGALDLDIKGRDIANWPAQGATLAFNYDTGMVGWAMLWLSQAFIVIFAIVLAPRYQFWEKYDEKVIGRKRDEDRAEIEHNEDVETVKESEVREQRGYKGTWRTVVAAVLFFVAVVGAIIVASQGPGQVINWEISAAVIATFLYAVALYTGRWTAANAATGIVIAASGHYLWTAQQLYNVVEPDNVLFRVENQSNTLLAGFCLAIIAMWLAPLLFIDPTTFKPNRIGGLHYASIVLAIIIWIGCIFVWSQDVTTWGVQNWQNFPQVSLFAVVSENFILAFFLIWAVLGYHCPTVCSVNFFLGWEAYQVLANGILFYKHWNVILANLLDDAGAAATDAAKETVRDYVVAGLSIIFIGLFLTWAYLLIKGPDCRPPQPYEKPEPVLQRYTYTPGYYEYTYTETYVSGTEYASESYYN